MRRHRLTLVLLVAVSAPSLLPAAERQVTFRERIAAERAIQRFYYSHQVGTTQPFDEARPPAFIERQAMRTLRLSAALDSYWHQPITAEMLWRETERLARDTRFPDRLAALYAALENDPVLFQEVVARAALADRLARAAFADDERLQGGARREAHDLVNGLRSGAIVPGQSDRRLSLRTYLLDDDAPDGAQSASAAGTTRLSRHDFESLQRHLSNPDESRASLRDEGYAYVVRVPLETAPEVMKVAQYTIPKPSWDTWWAANAGRFDARAITTIARGDRPLPRPAGKPMTAPESAADAPSLESFAAAGAAACGAEGVWSNGSLATPTPDGIANATSVWTGTEMIVWGGGDGSTGLPSGIRTGSRYDPLTDTWHPTALANSPASRVFNSAIWTGSHVIVWGGKSTGICNGTFRCSRKDGALYDPITDTWQPMATSGAPQERDQHLAVWTGSVMLVWGGESISLNNVRTFPNTGGRYDPATNSWSPITTLNAPTGRTLATAVWTGNRMIVWGGGAASRTNTGGQYDPVGDSWTATTLTGALPATISHVAVWSGQEMLVWGGSTSAGMTQAGSRYDPVLDQWTSMTAVDAPSGRQETIAAWTGAEMVVWGGSGGGNVIYGTGARYDPALDRWTPTSEASAPAARRQHAAVWTGTSLIVWGGDVGAGFPPTTNGRYDPLSDTWAPIDSHFVPRARAGHVAVWTGNLMLVTGGYESRDAGQYDPLLDLWTPTASQPFPGYNNSTVVWTGQYLIIWGGRSTLVVNAGWRYDPATDAWLTTTTANAPSARADHTAVWTGSRMIIWGGIDAAFQWQATGALYDPTNDSWQAMNTFAAPLARRHHAAVWTGSRMIVWGGDPNSSGWTNTGGIYNPTTNAWISATSLTLAPDNRINPAALWTGTEMLIWGGQGNSASNFNPINSGALYNPDTNVWRPMSQTNAPSSDGAPRASWTGSKMLYTGGDGIGAGGQYDVAADTWTTIPAFGSPELRAMQTVVQTGPAMIAWGGQFPTGNSVPGQYKDGGLYCPCATGSTWFLDGDSDGHGDPAASTLSCGPLDGYTTDGTDCNDSGTGVWALPSDTGVLMFSDAMHLEWTAPSNPGGTVPLSYDVVRGSNPELTVGGTCRAGDLSITSFDDPDIPPLGGFFYYRVRAGNSCGEGMLGTNSGGTPIFGGPVCP